VAVGCWLLVVGCWFLVVGNWLFLPLLLLLLLLLGHSYLYAYHARLQRASLGLLASWMTPDSTVVSGRHPRSSIVVHVHDGAMVREQSRSTCFPWHLLVIVNPLGSTILLSVNRVACVELFRQVLNATQGDMLAAVPVQSNEVAVGSPGSGGASTLIVKARRACAVAISFR
jgi:hypothetical protein